METVADLRQKQTQSNEKNSETQTGYLSKNTYIKTKVLLN